MTAMREQCLDMMRSMGSDMAGMMSGGMMGGMWMMLAWIGAALLIFAAVTVGAVVVLRLFWLRTRGTA
jgi:hypothetical protein